MKSETALTIMVHCKQCSGEGFQEVGPVCFKPASMCCGGCYEKHKCEHCGGSGEHEIDFTYTELKEYLESVRDGFSGEAITSITEKLKEKDL